LIIYINPTPDGGVTELQRQQVPAVYLDMRALRIVAESPELGPAGDRLPLRFAQELHHLFFRESHFSLLLLRCRRSILHKISCPKIAEQGRSFLKADWFERAYRLRNRLSRLRGEKPR